MPTYRPKSERPPPLREALDPIVESSSSRPGMSMDVVSKAILAPFARKSEGSNKLLTDLAPVLMTPRMMNAAATVSSRPRQSLAPRNTALDFATLGRGSMRFNLGTRRITSTDLQIVEATEELLGAEIPDPDGVASDVSLLRGFNATIPSAEKGKSRRRQARNVEVPRIGLKKLGMSARGLLMDEEEESVASDDDMVMVDHWGRGRTQDAKNGKARGRRKPRESFGAAKTFGKDELSRMSREITLDKENIHVRRSLINSEITEITHKIEQLDVIRQKLEDDLIKLQEEELELDDELQGVRERMTYEESRASSMKPGARAPASVQPSRRRKGPAFLPSEHDELPPGVAFMTLSHNSPICALDLSEPYGTLVSASSATATSSPEDLVPRVWDLLYGTEVGQLRGHDGAVRALQVEDHVCLTGGEDGTARLWDLRRVDEDDLVSVPEDDAESEDHQSVSEEVDTREPDTPKPNGIRSNGTHAVQRGPCVRVLEGHSQAVTALYFEDNCLVTGASDKTLRQWDLTTGQCVMTMDILWALSHTGLDASASFSGLPYHMVSGAAASAGHFAVPMPPSADGSWDMYENYVGGVQFWGYALVSGSGDGAVRMWDMRTGQAHRTLLGHTAPVTCLQFDEFNIISGGLDKSVRIWDLRTGGIAETIKYDHAVTALQFDTRKIVAAAGENGIKIYNRTSMQHSTLSTAGHSKPVLNLRYMDRYLVSGGRDNTLKVWAL